MVPDSVPDDQLLRRVASGDSEAFAALFRRRQGDVYRFALHMTASPAVADDVTQETFLAVMRDAGRYHPERATVAAWLCGIARNHVRRRLERDWRLQSLDGPGDDDAAVDDERLIVDDNVLRDLTRAERIAALRQAILALPIRYREVVVLCDLQELSYVEAAAASGCAIGTVRSRLHRGRALLAARLSADPGFVVSDFRVRARLAPTERGSGEAVARTCDGDRADNAREAKEVRRPIELSRRARSIRNLA
jgi:RNA polymerase sigma-70 factor, ECF subfamily